MSKNKVKVVIGGSTYALQGDESEEHMQRVARLINEKITEIRSTCDKTHMDQGKINTLLTLNLADECVKRQETLGVYKASIEKTHSEKEHLAKEVEELTLQLAQMKEQLALATRQGKKEQINRGR